MRKIGILAIRLRVCLLQTGMAACAAYLMVVTDVTNGEAGPKATLHLDCRIVSGEHFIEGSADAFCTALQGFLERDLDVSVSRSPATSGMRVMVRVDVVSENFAKVTISTGDGSKPSEISQITSYDRNISAGMSSILVRPIAVQLGLAK